MMWIILTGDVDIWYAIIVQTHCPIVIITDY